MHPAKTETPETRSYDKPLFPLSCPLRSFGQSGKKVMHTVAHLSPF